MHADRVIALCVPYVARLPQAQAGDTRDNHPAGLWTGRRYLSVPADIYAQKIKLCSGIRGVTQSENTAEVPRSEDGLRHVWDHTEGARFEINFSERQDGLSLYSVRPRSLM